MKALRACSLYIAFTITLLPIYAHAGWTPPVRISDEGASYGPRIAANGDTLHVVYWTSLHRSFYLRNEGGGWTNPLDIAFSDDSSGVVSPLIISKGDSIAVSWRNSFGFANRVNWGFRRSFDAGHGWSEIFYILPTHNYEIQKQALAGSDSALFFICSHIAQQEIIIEFIKSTNWGENWTEPMEILRTQETGLFNMVAREDIIHFVWVGRFNYDDEWEIYYIRSTDSGDSWSENVMLSTLDDEGSDWPSIAINEQGELIVCWMDHKYSPNLWRGDLFVRYSYDAGESWSEEEQITSTHDALYPNVIWQGDSIHVVWEDWRYDQGDIFYMLSDHNGTTWGEQQRIEDDPGMSLAPDLAVVNETVHVIWRQDSGLDGRGIYYSRGDEDIEIPTLTEWGMLILALLLLAVGTIAIARRRETAVRVERR